MNARLLFLSIVITLLLLLLPFAQMVTYPFLIFSTFIHETSHAIAAIISGGRVESLTVRMNGSGVTYTRGGSGFLISSAGYVGTSFIGGILLIFSRSKNNARKALYACSILICATTMAFAGRSNNLIVLTLLGCSLLLIARSRDEQRFSNNYWMPLISIVSLGMLVLYLLMTDSLFSWIAGIVLMIALFSVARFASASLAHFFLTFLAVQCSLNALDAIKTVYFLSLRSTCVNDAAMLASMTGVPASVWAALWFIVSLLLLSFSAIVYIRRSPVPQI